MRFKQLIDLINEYKQEKSSQTFLKMQRCFAELTLEETTTLLMLMGYETPEMRRRTTYIYRVLIALMAVPICSSGFFVLASSFLPPIPNSVTHIIVTVAPLITLFGIGIFYVFHRFVLPKERERMLIARLHGQEIPVLTASTADIAFSLFQDPTYIPRLVELRRSIFRFDPGKQLARLMNATADKNQKSDITKEDAEYLFHILELRSTENNIDLQMALVSFLIRNGYKSPESVHRKVYLPKVVNPYRKQLQEAYEVFRRGAPERAQSR